MNITCLKCGHVNAQATGDLAETCPACGVIYAKARPSPPRPASARPVAPLPEVPEGASPRTKERLAQAVGAHGGGRFIDGLRERSLYPAFRSVVGLFYLLGLALGLIALGVAGVLMWNGGVGTGLGAMVFGLLVLVVTKVGKEVSLMMADLTDAMIHLASKAGEPRP